MGRGSQICRKLCQKVFFNIKLRRLCPPSAAKHSESQKKCLCVRDEDKAIQQNWMCATFRVTAQKPASLTSDGMGLHLYLKANLLSTFETDTETDGVFCSSPALISSVFWYTDSMLNIMDEMEQ